MENDGFWRTVWRLRSMNNDKRTGSGSKLFLFIESLWQNQYWICLDREQTGPWAPVSYILEILQISIQFLILFRRHYGRNAQARPPSCPIFLPKISLMSVSGLHLKTWIMDMWYVGAPITKSFNQFKRNARLVMPHPCEMSAPRKAQGRNDQLSITLLD